MLSGRDSPATARSTARRCSSRCRWPRTHAAGPDWNGFTARNDHWLSSSRIAVAGTIGGVALAVALRRLSRSMLFGVDGTNGGILAAAVLVVFLAAAAAASVPMRRAARVDPVAALK